MGALALQVLNHLSYRNVIAVTSSKYYDQWLWRLGAATTSDYKESNIAGRILTGINAKGDPRVPFIFDCIASLWATVDPLRKIAERGSRVAIHLPVIVHDTIGPRLQSMSRM